MDAKQNLKSVKKRDVFICHSVNLHKKSNLESAGKPFTTPRFKKPINSSTLDEAARNRPVKSYGASLLVHRPYGLDV